jgi:hypothetical protein
VCGASNEYGLDLQLWRTQEPRALRAGSAFCLHRDPRQ